jgi:Uma2 family endonuclease
MTLSPDKSQTVEAEKKQLLTMYDLPSECPEDLGLPDEFHDLQPQLLSATLRLTDIARDRIFTGTDLNLYFDPENTLWYKRPDWFAVVNVPRLYKEQDMRMSYVAWDEGVSPSMIVELISEGTDREDLGLTEAESGKAPPKWTVYEQILKVPYYIVYDRYQDILRVYRLTNGQFQPLKVENDRVQLSELKIGLGLWQGEYQGITRKWLRWLDTDSNWIPTDLEASQLQLEQSQQQLEITQAQNRKLAEKLRSLGVEPDLL